MTDSAWRFSEEYGTHGLSSGLWVAIGDVLVEGENIIGVSEQWLEANVQRLNGLWQSRLPHWGGVARCKRI